MHRPHVVPNVQVTANSTLLFRVCIGEAEVECMGSSSQSISCNEQVCETWGPWSEADACSVTCGGGVAVRTRICSGGSPGSPGCQGSSRRVCAIFVSASFPRTFDKEFLEADVSRLFDPKLLKIIMSAFHSKYIDVLILRSVFEFLQEIPTMVISVSLNFAAKRRIDRNITFQIMIQQP